MMHPFHFINLFGFKHFSKMKKIILGALALCAVALYTACEKDSQLSDFQSSSLLAVDRGGSGDSTNLCMRGDTVDVSELPQAAADQIATDYPNATIQTVVKKHHGKAYAVELSDGTILIFKADGSLIGTCDTLSSGPHHGPGDHPYDGGCLGGDTLTVADLPQAAVDYVAANYPNETIQTVVSKFDGKAFAVELSDGTVLIFKADGTFVGTCPGGPGNGPGGGHSGGGHTGGGPGGGGPGGPHGGGGPGGHH